MIIEITWPKDHKDRLLGFAVLKATDDNGKEVLFETLEGDDLKVKVRLELRGVGLSIRDAKEVDKR